MGTKIKAIKILSASESSFRFSHGIPRILHTVFNRISFGFGQLPLVLEPFWSHSGGGRTKFRVENLNQDSEAVSIFIALILVPTNRKSSEV